MNLPFVSSAINFIRNNSIKIAIALLVVLVGAAGFSGWRYYQFRQTPEFAFARFKDALHPANIKELAAVVDFDALSVPLAKTIAQSYPFLKKGPDQLISLSDMIQTALLKQARAKEEPVKEEPDERVRLRTPLYALPHDFFTQLAAGMTMQNATESTAILSTKVRHPLLNKEFSLILRMDKTTEGWKVHGLVNGDELVKNFRAAQVERMTAQRKLLLDKNDATRKRIYDTLPIMACTASAGVLSDGKILLVVVNVQAKNIAQVAVNNVDLSASLSGPNGKELLQRFLNAVQPTFPGETFNRRWTIELDAKSPLGQQILAARSLSCAAFWQTLGMANGEVLHLVETPAPVEEFQ